MASVWHPYGLLADAVSTGMQAAAPLPPCPSGAGLPVVRPGRRTPQGAPACRRGWVGRRALCHPVSGAGERRQAGLHAAADPDADPPDQIGQPPDCDVQRQKPGEHGQAEISVRQPERQPDRRAGRALGGSVEPDDRGGGPVSCAGARTLDMGAIDTSALPGIARLKLGTGAAITSLSGTWFHR